MYLNKVMLYGNLTRDPETKALPNGNKVTTFGLATNRVYKDKDGNRKELTDFHNIVAFGPLADIFSKWLQKGRPVYIEGRITTRSWDDANGGGKKYRTEIIAENFQFGQSSASSSNNQSSDNESKTNQNDDLDTIDYGDVNDVNPDDIPF